MYFSLLGLKSAFEESCLEFEGYRIIEINEMDILLYFDCFGISGCFAFPDSDLDTARECYVDVDSLNSNIEEIVKTLHIDLIIVKWFKCLTL